MKVPRKRQQPMMASGQGQLPVPMNNNAMNNFQSNHNHGQGPGSGLGLGHSHVQRIPLKLPAGVVMPPSMDPSILTNSSKASDLMSQLTPSQMQAALNEFDEAMRNKGDKVRNTTAYLVGVVKRYVNVNSKERQTGAPVMGPDLTPIVKVTLQKMVDSNFCTQADLNENVRQKLGMLSEHDAILAMDELSNIPRETIRNFPSYFMGILNRYMRSDGHLNNNNKNHSGNGNGPYQDNRNGRDGGGGGNSLDRNHPNNSRRNDNRYRRSPSADSYGDDRRDRRGGRSRRRRSYSDDYSRSPSPDRGRDRDRNYRRR